MGTPLIDQKTHRQPRPTALKKPPAEVVRAFTSDYLLQDKCLCEDKSVTLQAVPTPTVIKKVSTKNPKISAPIKTKMSEMSDSVAGVPVVKTSGTA